MKTILVFLTTGFEEIEAVATVDILRRAGLDTKTVSLTGSLHVAGAHGITITADTMFDQAPLTDADMLVVPGGTPAYADHDGLKKALLDHDSLGKHIAAICAAPAVLGMIGILRGHRATCYPGYESYLDGATLAPSQPVVVDGNIVTGRGPGLTLDFALTIVETLASPQKRAEIAAQLLID